MVKVLSTTDVQSTKQIVGSLALDFSQLAQFLKGNPDAQLVLDEAWQKVQTLEEISHSKDVIVAAAQAAVERLAKQRDAAIVEAKHWKRAGDELAKEILAGKIAYDGEIPIKDVKLVLDVLSGYSDALDDPDLEELYEAIRIAGNKLLEEQLFEAASRKGK